MTVTGGGGGVAILWHEECKQDYQYNLHGTNITLLLQFSKINNKLKY